MVRRHFPATTMAAAHAIDLPQNIVLFKVAKTSESFIVSIIDNQGAKNAVCSANYYFVNFASGHS